MMPRTLPTLCLLLGACAQERPPYLDHDVFWGDWQSEADTEDEIATWSITLSLTGTDDDGDDTRGSWVATGTHLASSPTPGCVATLTYEGPWQAWCEEVLAPDPTDPAFPNGTRVPTGCVRFEVTTQRLGRSACTSTADDLPEAALPGDAPAAFSDLAYAWVGPDRLWIDWSGGAVLRQK